MASPDGHYSTQCTTNTHFFRTSLKRRRTTGRFLGQQSEVTIDDAWPQAGEMRSLWKGITELFGTDDMLQDATWRPNRHHSNIIPLFRNHVTQNAVAMFPPPPNPVISIEHGYRDSRLSAVPHTEDAEEKGRRVVLEMSELSNVYSSHHYEPYGTTESQDAATEAADPSCQRQDTSEGMSTPPGQPLGKWITNDKGEITETSNSVQRKLVTDDEKHHPNKTVVERT